MDERRSDFSVVESLSVFSEFRRQDMQEERVFSCLGYR